MSQSIDVVYFGVQNYHPSRVLTIAVLSFAFGTIIIMTYYEAKMNTRRRNLIGFTLNFIGSVSVLVVSVFYNDFNNYLLSSLPTFSLILLIVLVVH